MTRRLWPFGLALIVAVGCAEDGLISPVTVTRISPTGGTAVSHDGRMRLSFGSGAVPSSTDISIVAATTGLNLGAARSEVYRVLPQGMTFEGPVQVTINMQGTGTSWGIADVSGARPTLLSGTRFDLASGAVVASVSQLSSYAVFATDPFCGADAACGIGDPPGGQCDGGICVFDGSISPDPDGGMILACDAGICPPPDTGIDAGPPLPDAGALPPDAGFLPSDAGGIPACDAGACPPPDAGPAIDASSPDATGAFGS